MPAAPAPARSRRAAARPARDPSDRASGSRSVCSSSASSAMRRGRRRSRRRTTPSVAGSIAEQHVLCDRQVRRERQLLVDHRDAAVRRLARARAARYGSPSSRISPASDRYAPGQHLHQRALAGAVLADQRVHLARAHVEVDAAQRDASDRTPSECRGRTRRGWDGRFGRQLRRDRQHGPVPTSDIHPASDSACRAPPAGPCFPASPSARRCRRADRPARRAGA